MPYRFTKRNNGSIHSNTGRTYYITQSSSNVIVNATNSLGRTNRISFKKTKEGLRETNTGYRVKSTPHCNNTGCSVETVINGDLPIRRSTDTPEKIADTIKNSVKTIEGAVSAVLLLPKIGSYPVCMLLGDRHNGRERCGRTDNSTKSLYTDGNNSFLEFIKTKSKTWMTDVYMEAWSEKHESSRGEAYQDSNISPLFEEWQRLLMPCVGRSKSNKPGLECNYPSFRIHHGDVRDDQTSCEGIVKDIRTLIYRKSGKITKDSFKQSMKEITDKYVGVGVNGVSYGDIINAWIMIFDTNTSVYKILQTKLFKKHSIACKEFNKLPKPIKDSFNGVLKSWTPSTENNLKLLLFDILLQYRPIQSRPENLEEVVRKLNANHDAIEKDIQKVIGNSKSGRYSIPLNRKLVDVYTVSRMLKPIRRGLSSQLSISYFGLNHTINQFQLLSELYDVHTVWGKLPNMSIKTTDDREYYQPFFKTKCLTQTVLKGGKNKTRRKHRI